MSARTAILRVGLAAFVTTVVWSVAAAAPTACPGNYAGGEAPDILTEQLAQKVREVCREGFGSFHSGLAAVPLWSAEQLTAERVRRAKEIDRVDRFFAEPSLPESERAELGHYRGSGFDRGHLAPSADMDTVESQADSFSLANIIPQDPSLNRGLWAHIEATARGLALAYGEAWVVTGVAFEGGKVRQVGGRVLVPSAVWKAVYVPSVPAAAAWWAPNEKPGDIFEVISVEELAERTGIQAFPSVPLGIREVGARLPEPSPRADRIKPAKKEENSGW